jgi:hypothetical protein
MDALSTAMHLAGLAVEAGEIDIYSVEIKPNGTYKIIGYKNGSPLEAPFWEQFN